MIYPEVHLIAVKLVPVVTSKLPWGLQARPHTPTHIRVLLTTQERWSIASRELTRVGFWHSAGGTTAKPLTITTGVGLEQSPIELEHLRCSKAV